MKCFFCIIKSEFLFFGIKLFCVKCYLLFINDALLNWTSICKKYKFNTNTCGFNAMHCVCLQTSICQAMSISKEGLLRIGLRLLLMLLLKKMHFSWLLLGSCSTLTIMIPTTRKLRRDCLLDNLICMWDIQKWRWTTCSCDHLSVVNRWYCVDHMTIHQQLWWLVCKEG